MEGLQLLSSKDIPHTTEPGVEAPKEVVAVEMEPVSEAAATPAVATPNEPFDTAEKKALPVDESLSGKHWYNQGQEYLDYYTETPWALLSTMEKVESVVVVSILFSAMWGMLSLWGVLCNWGVLYIASLC